MSHRKHHNRRSSWVGVVFVAIFVPALIFVGAVYYFIEIGPTLLTQKEAKNQTELQTEFKLIAPLPGVNLVYYESCSAKDAGCLGSPGQYYAMVSAKYFLANIQPIDVFNYYDKELKAQGWHFCDTGGSDWNKDWSSRSVLYAFYKKGDYYATLQFAGKYSDQFRPWTYVLLMSWNGGSCEPKQ